MAITRISQSTVKENLEKYNSFVGGYPGVFGNYESIATVTLMSDAATIAFTSIPQNYQHLQIRGIWRTDYNAVTGGPYLEVNGDTTGPYAAHRIYGTGSAVTADGSSAMTLGMYGGLEAGDTNPANVFGAVIMDFLDYTSTSKTKTQKIFTGFDGNGQGWVALYSGLWTGTAAITSLKFKYGGTAKFRANSTLALYGIKVS